MVDAAGTEAVIQGVTAPMVAVPGPAQALMARSAGFGGTMPGMTAKIALRGGNQEARRVDTSLSGSTGRSRRRSCPAWHWWLHPWSLWTGSADFGRMLSLWSTRSAGWEPAARARRAGVKCRG